MDDNPEIRDRLNVNKSTYHNKRPRERFICFIRGAKWMKINQLNGPSPIHDTSTWLSQSIQSIIHVCYWLDMQKNLPWKCFRRAFGYYDFRSTSASQQAWRMRKRYHLLLFHTGCRKSARDNPQRYCGLIWVHCSRKKYETMAQDAMDVCLRVPRKASKVGSTATVSKRVFIK